MGGWEARRPSRLRMRGRHEMGPPTSFPKRQAAASPWPDRCNRSGSCAGFSAERRDWSWFRNYFPSTSFQNSAAGLSLILSKVLMERSSSASREALKSQLIIVRGISLRGVRSETCVE